MASPLDIDAIQRALRDDGLDGWLLYDFHGSNPIAQRLTGLEGRHTTRRWFYLIPREGTPHRLVHAIESQVLDHLPGETRVYAGRSQFTDGLAHILGRAGRVAMEYSPHAAIPYVSRVDAGTVELVRATGTGAMVSVARCGAICGPIFAGLLLQAKLSVSMVLLLLAPIMATALCFCLVFLAARGRLLRAQQVVDEGRSA